MMPEDSISLSRGGRYGVFIKPPRYSPCIIPLEAPINSRKFNSGFSQETDIIKGLKRGNCVTHAFTVRPLRKFVAN